MTLLSSENTGKKDDRIWATLRNRDAQICFFWIVVQQAVVAASTYLLVRSAQNTTTGALESAALCALGFAFLLVLVYIPNTISLYFMQRWRLLSLENFIALFVQKNSGKTTLRHPEVRRKHEPLLTNEATTVFEQITNLRYELASTVLSAVLNIGVIGLVVAPGILIWYGLAGVLLALSSGITQSRIQAVAVDMQAQRKQLSGAMLRAWENVFAGNTTNLSAWRKLFALRLHDLRSAAVRYDLTRSTISGLTVSTALLLISIGNAWYFLEHKNDVVGLSALLITLPRQLQTIQHIFSFFNVLLSYKGVCRQFESLGRLLDMHESADDPLQHVDFEKIDVFINDDKTAFSNPEQFWEYLLGQKGIRVTLRGPNGVGKSTLVAVFAEKLYPNRIFIPSYTTEFEFSEALTGLSDGRRAMAILTTLGNERSDYILLDEWDANLDAENTARMDQQIADWVLAGRVVIETRHRKL